MNSGLLLMSVMGLLFPAVLHFTHTELHFGKSELALSRFSSCVMLVAYGAYLFYQLTSQNSLYMPIAEVGVLYFLRTFFVLNVADPRYRTVCRNWKINSFGHSNRLSRTSLVEFSDSLCDYTSIRVATAYVNLEVEFSSLSYKEITSFCF